MEAMFSEKAEGIPSMGMQRGTLIQQLQLERGKRKEEKKRKDILDVDINKYRRRINPHTNP